MDKNDRLHTFCCGRMPSDGRPHSFCCGRMDVNGRLHTFSRSRMASDDRPQPISRKQMPSDGRIHTFCCRRTHADGLHLVRVCNADALGWRLRRLYYAVLIISRVLQTGSRCFRVANADDGGCIFDAAINEPLDPHDQIDCTSCVGL
jgi:hypothetical protein